jgi:uncharacterized phiE125 gp8 family phage protein
VSSDPQTSKPRLVTPPSGSVVSLAEAKAHARIFFDEDDAEISALIEAAVDRLDGYDGVLGRCLLSQEWKQGFSGWGSLRLPFPDVDAVAVSYLDADGIEQTVSDDLYGLNEDHLSAYIKFARDFTAPPLADTDFPVTVTMTVGYGDADDIPQMLKLAVMNLAVEFYENRGATGSDRLAALPIGIDAMIAPYRRPGC